MLCVQQSDTMHPSSKFIVSISCAAVSVEAWTYNDITAWATGNANCASSVENQSPVDIANIALGTTSNPLTFQGFPDSSITAQIKSALVINNHTWELEWDVDDAATDPYGVMYNNHIYKLNQFHFHSPSEHTVDGQHFDMEAHLVHSCTPPACTTVDEHDENLVVGIFMNIGAENSYLSSFWNDLTALAANSSAPHIIDNMASPYNAFLPDSKDFYRYVGSTTTPSCVENVSWFLMSTPVTLSLEQLTAYRTAISNHANTQTAVVASAPQGVSEGWNVALGTNNRALQPLGNRLVEKYTVPVPLTSNIMHAAIISLVVVVIGFVLVLLYWRCSEPSAPKVPKAKRAIKAVKKTPPPAPRPEEVPLVPLMVPQAPMPHLFTQPMHVPMTYASPVQMQAPQMQPQFMQPQYMVAP